jgi:hypothetical protein
LFGAAGLGAGLGVATATVYGAMVMAANLPGAAVLIASRLSRLSRLRRGSPLRSPGGWAKPPKSVTATTTGAANHRQGCEETAKRDRQGVVCLEGAVGG